MGAERATDICGHVLGGGIGPIKRRRVVQTDISERFDNPIDLSFQFMEIDEQSIIVERIAAYSDLDVPVMAVNPLQLATNRDGMRG